jgi:hypothetical protein
MAQHRVEIDVVPAEIINTDVIFRVHADGRRFGKLTVSRGGIGWFPSSKQKERHLSWGEFDRLVKKHFQG